MACEDINDPSWSGVIMKSACNLLDNQTDPKGCQTIQQLNMTLQQELPAFDWNNNVTYRNTACAECSNEGNLSFWGVKVTCSGFLQPPQHDLTAFKRFMKENVHSCSWKYAAFPNLKHSYKWCVVQDSQCDSNQLPVMSVVKELCSAYSMVFSVDDESRRYRNPHCALCNIKGRLYRGQSFAPPLTILLDVSSDILKSGESQTSQPPTQGYIPTSQSSNMTSQVLNCSSSMKNCTVMFGGKTCVLLTLLMNQTTQMDLNISQVKVLTAKQILFDMNAMKPKARNTVFILCPDPDTIKYDRHGLSAALSYITFTGLLLSIVSLCFLLGVYLSFKELRNLPGKCLISLSWAVLSYQIIFAFAKMSREVSTLCKVVAICLHFFVLASFSWMSVLAFDTANAFKIQGKYNPQLNP